MNPWPSNNFSQFPPMDLFPPFLQEVILDVSNKIKAPPALICALLLGVMAEATQGGFDVEIPGFGLSPLALWILVIAGSGIGKTPVERLLRRFVREFEIKHQEQWKRRKAQYEADMQIWLIMQDKLQRKVNAELMLGFVTQETRAQVAVHQENKPIYPGFPKIAYSDATPAAIKHGLAKNWSSITVASDEASLFFSGRLVGEWGMLNVGWDGGRIACDRKEEGDCAIVDDPRISMILQVQDGVIERYLQRRGTEMRDLGSFARFLISVPPSNQGYRFRDGQEISTECLDEFQRRAGMLLERSVDSEGNLVTVRTVLKFSPSASELFIDIHNQFELAQQPGNWLCQAKDYASKATRHIARIAAMLHLFECGPESTEISWESLNCASNIMTYFINQFVGLFTLPPAIPPIVTDSNELYAWLCARGQADCNRYVMRSDIQRLGPLRLRKSIVLDGVLQNLQSLSYIGWWKTGRIAYVDLTPLQPFDPIALDAAIRLHRERRAPKAEGVIQQQ